MAPSSSALQTPSLESKIKDIKALESRLASLKIKKLEYLSPKKLDNSRRTTKELDWSQFISLQPEPFFAEFIRVSPIITYVHDATRFHPFPRLPTEIRLQIWELARPGPQIVRLKQKKDCEGVYSTAPIPGIIQACKESRVHGLQNWYTLNNNCSFTAFRSKITFYFDPENDFLFNGCERPRCDSISSCIGCRTYWPYMVRSKAQRVILQANWANPLGTPACAPFSRLGRQFAAVREVILLSPDCPAGKIDERNILLHWEYLTKSFSGFVFHWQQGQSLLDISKSSASELQLEKATCMEVAITAQTCKAYGFMDDKFSDIDVEDLLQIPILGVRPLGVSYSTWRRLNSNDPRPVKREPAKPLSEEERKERFARLLKIRSGHFEQHTLCGRDPRNEYTPHGFIHVFEAGQKKRKFEEFDCGRKYRRGRIYYRCSRMRFEWVG